jgi:hypothetical protein
LCWIYYVSPCLAPLLFWSPWFTRLVFWWSLWILVYYFDSSWVFCLIILYEKKKAAQDMKEFNKDGKLQKKRIKQKSCK